MLETVSAYPSSPPAQLSMTLGPVPLTHWLVQRPPRQLGPNPRSVWPQPQRQMQKHEVHAFSPQVMGTRHETQTTIGGDQHIQTPARLTCN